MQHPIIVTQAPVFPVIQGAYRWLVAASREGGEQRLEVANPAGTAASIQKYDDVLTSFYYYGAQDAIAVLCVAPLPTAGMDVFKFQRLMKSWRAERNPASSVMEMVMCQSYQKIMGMGEAAVPLILNQLIVEGDEPDHWFWALRVITEIDPIPEEDRGDVRRMAQAWLRWGEMTGYAR